MLLLFGFLYALLFVLLFHKSLKQKPTVFYIAAIGLTGALVLYKMYSINKMIPPLVATYIVQVFRRGAFTTALFSIVMYLGVFIKKGKINYLLHGIRAELSIFASILTLGHNFSYGLTYFQEFFMAPETMKPGRFAATILTFIMMFLMLILTVTSFKSIRKKMKAKTWKNVQRLAYPFYMLIYVHVMILFWSDENIDYFSIGLYTLLFGAYAVLRISKYIICRRQKAIRMAC